MKQNNSDVKKGARDRKHILSASEPRVTDHNHGAASTSLIARSVSVNCRFGFSFRVADVNVKLLLNYNKITLKMMLEMYYQLDRFRPAFVRERPPPTVYDQTEYACDAFVAV